MKLNRMEQIYTPPVRPERISCSTCMRYINAHFTYLLTYSHSNNRLNMYIKRKQYSIMARFSSETVRSED